MGPTREDYQRIFEEECARRYPQLDEFERDLGYAVERERLEHAARTLACPFKVNPPNWQHGRVIYALIRRLAAAGARGNFLDVGTAKGFSAVLASWAIEDSGMQGRVVHSVDVMDPAERVSRNSVLELDGLKTIEEFTRGHVAPSVDVRFYGGGSDTLLSKLMSANERLCFAFIDGKHRTHEVRMEAARVREMQDRGAIMLFDDVQLGQVRAAVEQVSGYSMRYLTVNAKRVYAIGTRL